jgi:capsular exopolysaccharide synthesis family protein
MDNKLEKGISNSAFSQGDILPQENFLQIIMRHRWTILLTTILCLAITFLYLLKATPIYTSISRIYVEQSGPAIMSEYDGIMTQSKNYLHTQGELIRSNPIVTDAINDSKAKDFKTFTDMDNVVAYVKKNLDVEVGKKDDIITVSFDSPYPVEAAQIVNAIVQSYVKYQSSQKRSTVSEVRKIFQKEKVERDKELSERLDKLLEFTRENSIVSLDNQSGNIILDRLAKLSTELTSAQLNSLNAKADYEAVKSMENEPFKIKQFASASSTAGVQVFVSDTENQLQAEMRAAEIELKNTRYHCTEDHPAVKAVKEKIDRIKQELDHQAKEFADSYIEVARLRWKTAMEREHELQTSFDTQFQASRDLGIKETELSVLQSQVRRTERLCEILDNRIKDLNVTQDVGALNISILEVARPSDRPSKPEKARYLAITLVLGLTLGGGLAVLRDALDYRVRSTDEISSILGIPVLGVVPTMSESKAISLPGHKVLNSLKLVLTGSYQKPEATVTNTTEKESSSIFNDLQLTIEDKSIIERARKVRQELQSIRYLQRNRVKTPENINIMEHHEITTPKVKTSSLTSPTAAKSKTINLANVVKHGQKAFLAPKSIFAEAYRTIRTAVFFGIPHQEAKTILITSPAPGDGKSTVASNLAITMAQAGQKTLLLDADLRKPMQHKIFQIDNREGLTELIAGAVDMEDAIHHGPIGNLDILCCGVNIPNPSEVLNSSSFSHILRELSELYDRVIIDSPPVGPVADGQILSAISKITILVLRAEKSTRKHSRQAVDSLLSVGGHILGTVVNDVPRRHGRYGYYSGYDRYGGYGYYGHKETKALEEDPISQKNSETGTPENNDIARDEILQGCS